MVKLTIELIQVLLLCDGVLTSNVIFNEQSL